MTDNEILLQILNKLDSLENGQAELRADMEAGQAKLEASQARLENKLLKIETSVNHDLPRKIDLLMGQHGDIISRLDAVADYPETKGRVATLERAVQSHKEDIADLKEKAV